MDRLRTLLRGYVIGGYVLAPIGAAVKWCFTGWDRDVERKETA